MPALDGERRFVRQRFCIWELYMSEIKDLGEEFLKVLKWT